MAGSSYALGLILLIAGVISETVSARALRRLPKDAAATARRIPFRRLKYGLAVMVLAVLLFKYSLALAVTCILLYALVDGVLCLNEMRSRDLPVARRRVYVSSRVFYVAALGAFAVSGA